MDDQERIARDLAPQIEAALDGLPVVVEVTGAGVHWQVRAVAGERACKVHCFHYRRDGAEYYPIFERSERAVAVGRTRDVAATINAVRQWLIGAELEQLYREHPFVDRSKRAHLQLQARVEQNLATDPIDARVVLEAHDGDHFELWVYAEQRSCQLAPRDGAVGVALCIRTTQVALVEVADPELAASLVREWIAELRAIAEVYDRHPSAKLSPHAELLEAGDVAGWTWANLFDRTFDPETVFVGYRPLIEKIVAAPAVSRFFAFTSHDRLCFSRCSHYPFATDGMPVLHLQDRTGSPRYVVRRSEGLFKGDVDETLALLERVLLTITEPPWDGIAAEPLAASINTELAARGSRLRLRTCQRMQWLRVVACSASGEVQVDVDHGQRFCELRLDTAAGVGIERARPRSASEAAERIIGWLDREAG